MSRTMRIVHAPTEERNRDTSDIDLLPAIEILHRINEADAAVPEAVAAVLPELALVVDAGVTALGTGGRVHYFGAGTSGRLAALDAVELPPTFGIPPDRVVAHPAGGAAALLHAVEEAEDNTGLGVADAAVVGDLDLAIGLSASGRTPYVAGALRAARGAGAATALISANPGAELAAEVDVHIGVDTGAEVIAGSTRMKAGTAQKLLLNAFSTTVMVRLGYTYSNLMVGVDASNAKLRGRVVTILVEATGLTEDACAAALAEAGGNTRIALVSLLSEVTVECAAAAVRSARGSVRVALDRLRPVRP